MSNENNTIIQVIMLPYHGQGHMNTMVQFAKRLAWKNVHVTIATTFNTTQQLMPNISSYKSITLEPIYDDTNDNTLHIKDRMARFEAEAAPNLAKVLSTKKEQACNKKCLLVYHGGLHWALMVARQQKVAAAAFFTAAAASFACYYYMHIESQGAGTQIELPSVLPPPDLIVKKLPKSFLSYGDYNSHISDKMGLHPLVLWLLKDYGNAVQADFVLLNSFDKLEEEALKLISNICNVKTIGPTIPSTYLDKQMENDVDYGFNQYKPTNEDCMKWLSTKPARSIVYIAFGSVARLTGDQMVEIAEALKERATSFLWVVRETEQEKLPGNLIEEISGNGMVLPWAPQLEVLAHEAVGCFMSHCGWNSTIEALSFGVPVLAMPQFLDQLVDAHLVEKVWGVGIMPKENQNGLVTRKEIRSCLDEILEGQKGEKIKENVAKWRGFAKEALDKGGSSDMHIDEIIEWVASS
ncbi:mogroside I-E synthase-like [Silene latifolia]|uniref:mogroside I-E synthase-like n=1 Tax=Silene latifolia TaxID=37657 RepID=UPI003D781A3F